MDWNAASGPPNDPQGWLYWILSEVHSGVRHLTDGHQRLEQGQDQIHRQLADGRSRMDWHTHEIKRLAADHVALKAEITSTKSTATSQRRGAVASMADMLKAAQELATAVAPIKEWLTGASVVASSLYAILQPEKVLAWWHALTAAGP